MTLAAFTEFSHGSMRAPDVAYGILFDARRYLDAATIAALESIVESDDDSSDAHEDVIEAMDSLQEHAAPYCYIGAHIGDGSCFGVWPDVDSMLEDDDILRVSDGCEIPAAYEGLAAIVNDHGNVTLVSCRGPDQSDPDYCSTVEIWACV